MEFLSEEQNKTIIISYIVNDEESKQLSPVKIKISINVLKSFSVLSTIN